MPTGNSNTLDLSGVCKVRSLVVSVLAFTFYPDIDECSDSTDNCHTEASCTNNAGGFDCTCNSGYSGDGVTCSGKFLVLN